MKVYVFGAGGMLGKALIQELQEHNISHVALTREQADVRLLSDIIAALDYAGPDDVVINAAGVRHGYFDDPINMSMVNAVSPHLLSSICDVTGCALIHVSTDCVYNYPTGEIPAMHAPSGRVNPRDRYAQTKLAGEPSNACVLRTSFIGPDHGLFGHLLDHKKGDVVEAWSNAIWSGSTVWEVAYNIVQMIYLGSVPIGTFNLATSTPISKAAIVRLINDMYDLGLEIYEVAAPLIDRSMQPSTFFTLPPLLESKWRPLE